MIQNAFRKLILFFVVENFKLFSFSNVKSHTHQFMPSDFLIYLHFINLFIVFSV